jgi:hypothetical protein
MRDGLRDAGPHLARAMAEDGVRLVIADSIARDQDSARVMAGLVPAIHVFHCGQDKDVDARVKPAHDECGKSSRDVLLLGDAQSPKQNQICGG